MFARFQRSIVFVKGIVYLAKNKKNNNICNMIEVL